MKRSDYIIIILIIITWIAEDIYHLFPRSYWVDPFPYSDKIVTIRRYVHDNCTYLRFGIFAACLLIKRIELHWITRDIILITIGLTFFSMIWYDLFYGNPFYKAELWLKFVTVIVIYLSIISIRWHGRRSNRVSNW